MSEVLLVGGEMEFWDEPDAPGSPVLAALVAHVLDGVAPRRVLLLGPQPPEVLDVLAAQDGLEVVALLRSQPAAERLSARHPGFLVRCGDPGRTSAAALGGPAAFLLALGGLEATASADEPWRPWSRIAEQVLALCAPDALLVVGHERTVSTASLAGAPRRESDRDPARWFPGLGHDASRPRDAVALAAALGRGDAPVGSWVVPALTAPAVALPVAWVPSSHGTVAGALLERAAGAEVAVAGPLVRDSLAQGLGAVLAQAEVAVVGARPGDAAWVLDADGEAAPAGRAELDGPGDLVLSRLLERCARHDLPGLVDDLTALRAWAGTTGAGRSCLPDDTMVGPDGVTAVPGAPAGASRDDRQAVALVASALAATLERLGWERPWPRNLDADELARVVAGLLGVELGRGALADVRPLLRVPAHDAVDGARVRRLEDEVAALRGRTRTLENALRTRDRQVWSERAVTEGAATSEERKALRKEAKPPPPPPTTTERVRRRLGRLRRG